MAYPINRIANFTFVVILGEPDEATQRISIDDWSGADGLEFTDEGLKASGFSLKTLVDCNDLGAADILLRAYKSLALQGSVAIVKDGELLIDRFKVLNVFKFARQRLATAVGNKQSQLAGAILECRWDLVAVP